jgi:hypothetical protein
MNMKLNPYGLLARLVLFGACCAYFTGVTAAFSQNASEDDSSALGVRQERVKRMLKELEGKSAELSRKLREEQPDQADKLDSAFKQSKELLLEQRMDDITTMLNAAKLETATEAQDALVGDVKSLIAMLLEEDDGKDKRQKEIEQLEAWKKQLDNLIWDENKLKSETEIMENKEGALNDLERQMEKLQDLIGRQESLKEKTEAGDEAKAQDDLDKMADEQADIRKETEELAESAEQTAAEAPEGEEAQSPGLEKMQEASKSQKGSEKSLEEGQPKDSGAQQEKAVEKMKEALAEMKKEKERIEKMDERERAEELAKEQEKTAEDTGDLQEEMAQSSQSAEEADEQKGVKGAQKSMQKAQESMKKAQQSLAEQKSGEAGEQEQKAQDELQEAREQIEEKIEEMKEEEKKEQLAKLEEIFREMLDRQQLVTAGTAKVEVDRQANENAELKRAQRIALTKWMKEERSLSEKAGETYELLFDEDKSIVFRTVVEELQFSLEYIADMMDEQKTGGFVKESQVEVEETLKELIAALEKEQQLQEQKQQQQQQQQQQQSGEQDKSLLQLSAELKLLKLAQLRINRLTTVADESLPEDRKADDATKKAIDDLVGRQTKLSIMALEMASRVEQKSDEQID